MHLMTIVKKTIIGAKREIIMFLTNSALIILVFNLYMDNIIITYPFLLSCTVLFIYLVIKGISLAEFYNQLEKAQISDEYYSGGDDFQNQVFATISNIHEKYTNHMAHFESKTTTRSTLFTQFIHGMKSSVSIIGFACDKLGTEKLIDSPLSDIYIENEKLKKSLEQTLNILRLDAFANDYIPERINLAELVTRIINEHKRDFIYTGVFPKLNGSAFVYTDSKWCGFIISQLISNAIKYSSTGDSIFFEIESFEKHANLRIVDNGIGIPAEDLTRIFDIFFTGINGRQRKESTGIGLFMVKHIADRLGILVNIDSEIKKGTTVILTFVTLQKGKVM